MPIDDEGPPRRLATLQIVPAEGPPVTVEAWEHEWRVAHFPELARVMNRCWPLGSAGPADPIGIAMIERCIGELERALAATIEVRFNDRSDVQNEWADVRIY